MPFRKVDCSESVEEALARLDLEAKQNKLAREKAKREKEEAAKKKLEVKKDLTKENAYEDPMSTDGDAERDVNFPLNEKARSLYPERGGNKHKPGWFAVAFKGEGREGLDKLKCEMNVWEVIKKSKLNIKVGSKDAVCGKE